MDLAGYYAHLLRMIFTDYEYGERRMPDAPGEFLSGWVYGISLQQDDLRNALMSCIKVDDDLTNDMYDGMAAYEKGDNDTGKKKMHDA